MCTEGYAGWRPSAGAAAGVGSVRVADVTAEAFFNDYVVQRRPVVLLGLHCQADPATLLERIWESSREQVVLVEQRGQDGVFGRGLATEMTLGAFFDQVDAGTAENLYLTVQPPERGGDGARRVVGPPLSNLVADGTLPLRPHLLPTLVPSSINAWIGGCSPQTATTPSSSGLHHDYEDNLYMLLQGSKTFRLFPPSDTCRLYPRGTVFKIHPNGRVNYQGGETAGDGTVLPQHRNRANEPAGAPLDRGARLAQAAEGFAGLDGVGMAAALDLLLAHKQAVVSDGGEVEIDFGLLSDACLGALEALLAPARESRPNHTAMPHALAAAAPRRDAAFPLYAEATELVAELRPGQMLYLPCGWWHEVRTAPEASGKGLATCAINYWFHPPDGKSYRAPYSSGFWEERLCRATDDCRSSE